MFIPAGRVHVKPDLWRGIWGLLFGHAEGYQPLAILMLGVEHRLWGLDPLGYHAVNLAIHLLNTWLVMVWLRRLGLEGTVDYPPPPRGYGEACPD